jgi:hypothetical protein
LLDLPDPLGGREEDGLSDEGLPDPLDGREEELLPEDLLGGRDEELLPEDLPEPLGGREELELLLGLSDPDCLGVLPESLTIQQM